MKKKTGLVITAVLLMALIFISQNIFAQKFIARTTASFYMTIKGNNQKIVDVEYVSSFDNYAVSLEGENGEKSSLILSPSFFPVSVEYDPANPPMSD